MFTLYFIDEARLSGQAEVPAKINIVDQSSAGFLGLPELPRESARNSDSGERTDKVFFDARDAAGSASSASAVDAKIQLLSHREASDSVVR